MRVKPTSTWILVLSCFITASLLISYAGASQISGEFIYTVTDGEATITGYTGEGWVVVIPAKIKGVSVTGIGSKAFYKKGVTRVAIPNSVTVIGDSAFVGNRLTTIIIPESVTSIGSQAFVNNRLDLIVIMNSAAIIGQDAFEAQYADEEVPTIYGISGSTAETYAIEHGYQFILLQYFTFTDGDYSYSVTDRKATITGYTGGGSHVVIPAELGGYPVTIIGVEAFSAKELTSVVIPDSVTTIGIRAFDANPISSLTIPEGVIFIGEHAFNCNPLTKVFIPDSVTYIGKSAFENIQRDPAELTICGIVASAAETYANENGYVFEEHSGDNDRSPAVRYLLLGLGLLAVVGAVIALWMKRKHSVHL